MSKLILTIIEFEMPYYHVRVKRTHGRPSIVYEFDLSKKRLEALLEQTKKKGEMFLYPSFEWIKEKDIEDIDVAQTSRKSSHYGIGRLKGKNIFERGKIVTSQFIKKPLSQKKTVFPKAKLTEETLSKNVFIVHGRDHKPMKELKTMLSEFGLNPIVLHEKASGSRTLPEKLEKESEQIGYAFVILTPDDIGGHREHMRKILGANTPMLRRHIAILEHSIDGILNHFEPRARQNVILELGYFWGLLKRKKVCCLLKGNVEKPSDMHGIVYVPFKDSIEEARDMIIKELEAAGYEIKVKKQRKKTTEKKIQEIREETEKILDRLKEIV